MIALASASKTPQKTPPNGSLEHATRWSQGPQRTDISVTELTSQALMSPSKEAACRNIPCGEHGAAGGFCACAGFVQQAKAEISPQLSGTCHTLGAGAAAHRHIGNRAHIPSAHVSTERGRILKRSLRQTWSGKGLQQDKSMDPLAPPSKMLLDGRGSRRTDIEVTELTSQASMSPLNERACLNMPCDA